MCTCQGSEGTAGSSGVVLMPQERALGQHTGKGVSPLCETSGKEKEVSQPFPPLLFLSQFFSGHLDLQIHCSYLAFVGESMELVSAKVLLLPSRL